MVVEFAEGIRPGGQTVDLRGAGRAVIERMGLLEQLRARQRAGRTDSHLPSRSPRAGTSQRLHSDLVICWNLP